MPWLEWLWADAMVRMAMGRSMMYRAMDVNTGFIISKVS